ncbi:radical SAM protein [bacterium]|nr:MAG: radical SAM protein [bacterium]
MAKKKQLIIPVFIPFAGCAHQCVYCDQPSITATEVQPDTSTIVSIVERHLSTWKHEGRIEIAFYGGTFTALSKEAQSAFLKTAYVYVKAGRVHAIRISTRPDFITNEILELLIGYGVDTVELGAQSMCDDVLTKSGRGHTADDTVRAVSLLRARGFKTGIQFMPGLPGDSEATINESAKKIAALSPDFIRIYPTVVLKNTPLYKMFLSGKYIPWPLDKMVRVCKTAALIFAAKGIPIIRMGLQQTAALEENIVAGPHHPSFRQLVDNLAGA